MILHICENRETGNRNLILSDVQENDQDGYCATPNCLICLEFERPSVDGGIFWTQEALIDHALESFKGTGDDWLIHGMPLMELIRNAE